LDILNKAYFIENQIRQHKFTFQPFLHVQRRVKQNKLRDIYVATWQDKIVDKWLNESLSIAFDKWFSNNSYAYRVNNFGIDVCQQKISKSLIGKPFIIKRDITNYFYTIDHDILLDKLACLIDKNDYLYQLVKDRIIFKYVNDGLDDEHVSNIGIPFGSSIACVLSNVYLTDVDKKLSKLPINYFRYADDFIMLSSDQNVALDAASLLDESITSLKLSLKQSHRLNLSFIPCHGFIQASKFKHLGLEFTSANSVRLSVEKQRKIINLFKRSLESVKARINRECNINNRIKIAVDAINSVILDRIRSVAIIDYYLKHVNDEQQLQSMDLIIAKIIIGCVLNKKFKNRDFSTIRFKQLRDAGLISLKHRHRLHAHGHIKIDFMTMRNDMLIKRRMQSIDKKIDRINQLKMIRKINSISNVNDKRNKKS
jgi:hypothetical protein